jgi:mannan endo-1,6-alpha-mannosidase
MTAAESNFPNPPSEDAQWLALAQAVFNSQALRWDPLTCSGGLRWQIFTFNNGYNYKNSISNGAFFQLAARLARYTGNQTYADWAEKTFDWVQTVGLMSSDYKIYDGTDVLLNCSQVDHIQWTYNGGMYLLGAAMMYNYTGGSQVWADRVSGILAMNTATFFPTGNIMSETACESNGKCDVDQRSFKAYLSRWMALTTQMASFTAKTIMPQLLASAQACAATCTGLSGTTCGLRWNAGATFDGSYGVGEEMAAMSVFQSNLISLVAPPFTAVAGGTSKGDPSAGTTSTTVPGTFDPASVTTGSKVGGGFLTVLLLVGVLGGAWWMVT